MKKKKPSNERTLQYNWSKSVKERDKYSCRVCGIIPHKKFLHSHHVLCKSKFPKHTYIRAVGISVCIMCHAHFFHADFKNFILRKPRKCTQKDWFAFLKSWKDNIESKIIKEKLSWLKQ